MKFNRHSVTAAVVLLGSALGIGHATPLTTMIQGYLTTPSNIPITAQSLVEFKVFQGGLPGTAGSGSLVYDETGTVTPNGNGIFTYPLGSGTPTQSLLIVNGVAQPNVLSTATYNTAQPVFVEMSVGGNVLLPRLWLSGVPYAVISAIAEHLNAGSQIDISWLNVASSDTSRASITTSSNVVVNNGGVFAPFFYGTPIGDGSQLRNLSLSALPPTVALTSQANVFTQTQTLAAAGLLNPSLVTSSSIIVNAGGVYAPFFYGTPIGDGSLLQNVVAKNVAPGNVLNGTLNPGVSVNAGSLINGPIAASLLPGNVALTNAINTFTADQAMTSAGGLTVSNGVNAGTLKLASQAPAAPAANTAYANSIVKGWVTFNGSTMQVLDSFNVATVTKVQSGIYTVNWATPFTNAAYAPSCMFGGTPDIDVCFLKNGSPSTGSVTFQIENAQMGWLEDASFISIMAVGRQ